LPTAALSTNTERHGHSQFTVAITEMNGWRSNMEDAHVIKMEETWGYFGVLDGHGGDECSEWCHKRLYELLAEQGCPADDAAAKKLVLQVDAEFLATGEKGGSTAAMCVIRPQPGGKYAIHVINAGDSRVLLGKRDGSIVDGGGTDQGLTVDHKPDHPGEQERVYRCGGTVEEAAGGVLRVNGDLAVSRGFGDAQHKKTGGPSQEDRPVTCDPEMGHFVANKGDFVLVVCDGVSEGNYPNPEVIDHAAAVFRETGDAGAACTAVCHRAVERNSKDNISCMMIILEPAKTQGVSHEFIPGPLNALDNSGFLSAYKCMAKRGKVTFAKACEMRFENLSSQGRLSAEEQQELQSFGTPAATKGSPSRAQYFEKWAAETEQNAGGSSEQDQMQMLMQMMRARGGVPPGMEEPENGRRVLVAPLPTLRRSVDNHTALKWDERMEGIAGTEGIVKTDDPSDGTTHVRFPPPVGVVAWLPTEALTDV